MKPSIETSVNRIEVSNDFCLCMEISDTFLAIAVVHIVDHIMRGLSGLLVPALFPFD